jgi:hypothetical protein
MEARTIDHAANRIAEQKLLIIRQQHLAAELARNGRSEEARRARAKLLKLLNQYDLMRETSATVERAA